MIITTPYIVLSVLFEEMVHQFFTEGGKLPLHQHVE
jgi:hypothetical protein